MSDEKAELNREIGMLYYHTLVNAGGFPTGMAYWHDMDCSTQYYHTVTGLDFLRALERSGLITLNKPMGLDIGAKWDEGDCKALMDSLESHRESDQQQFTERLEQLRKQFNEQ